MDNLSKSELRMLLSVMEGELEARDLVIEALRVRNCYARSHCCVALFLLKKNFFFQISGCKASLISGSNPF